MGFAATDRFLTLRAVVPVRWGDMGAYAGRRGMGGEAAPEAPPLSFSTVVIHGGINQVRASSRRIPGARVTAGRPLGVMSSALFAVTSLSVWGRIRSAGVVSHYFATAEMCFSNWHLSHEAKAKNIIPAN